MGDGSYELTDDRDEEAIHVIILDMGRVEKNFIYRTRTIIGFCVEMLI